MRYLVTGGAGYVGSHLTRKLLAQGHHVRVLDSFLYGREGLADLHHERLETIHGDIRDLPTMLEATEGVDAVIALAAIVGDGACAVDPSFTRAVNLDATRVLAKACDTNRVSRLVFASSCSVYGASDDGLLTEESALHPVSLYAQTRIESERILLNGAFPSGNCKPVILRLSTVFGLSPRMRFDLYVNLFAAKAVREGSIHVFGGDQWRPNLHVQDAAEAFMLAAAAPEADVAGKVFNVGADEDNARIADVAALVQSHVPSSKLDFRPDVVDRRNYRVSFRKIEGIGFRPTRRVADGVREIVAALSHGFADHQAERFSNVKVLARLLGGAAPTSWEISQRPVSVGARGEKG